MNISKNAVSVTLAVAGLVLSGGAFAMPGISEQAPESSIKLCVAEIGEQANYDSAGRVRHEVDSKAGRVSGHKLIISTTVFDAADGQLIREYATVCAVSDEAEVQGFKFKEKSI